MKKSFLILLLLSLSSVTFAQDTIAKISRTWLDLGMGSYNSSSVNSGLVFSGAVTNYNGKRFIKGRLVYGNEFVVGDLLAPEPSESFLSMGAEYGKGFYAKEFTASISGGIAFISGVKRGGLTSSESGLFGQVETYEEVAFAVPSLPFSVDLTLKPSKSVGLGFSVLGEVNKAYTYFGFLARLSLGQQRP